MSGVNKVILIGRLGNDPEVKFLANGDAVANISIATSEKWKDKATGQPQEKTEWHRVVFFKRQAEIVGEYLRKGSNIYVEGKLETRKWQDQSGQDRYTTEIKGMQLHMLDGKSDGVQQQAPQQAPIQQPPQMQQPQQVYQQRQAPPQQPPQQQVPQNFANDFNDDIPGF